MPARIAFAIAILAFTLLAGCAGPTVSVAEPEQIYWRDAQRDLSTLSLQPSRSSMRIRNHLHALATRLSDKTALRLDDQRHKLHIRHWQKQAAFPGQAPPARQLRLMYAVSPRDPAHRSPGLQRLGNDPRLELIRPAAATAQHRQHLHAPQSRNRGLHSDSHLLLASQAGISNQGLSWKVGCTHRIRIRREAGIEDVRLHDLRHTVASHAVMNGVPVPVVSRLLGHSNVRMTLRYAHLADREVEAAAERAGNAIAQIMSGEPLVRK